MAKLIPIVVNDGKTTPVARTFSPNMESGVLTKFVELSTSGALNARPTLEIAVKPIGLNGRTTQEVVGTFHIPLVVTETVNGVTRDKVVGVNHYEFKATSSGASSKIDRKDGRVMLANLLNNASVINLIDDAEGYTS